MELSRNKKIVLGAILSLVIAGIAVSIIGIPTNLASVVGGGASAVYGECNANRQTGNIQGSCEDDENTLEQDFNGYNPSTGQTNPAHFWVKINSIEVYADGGDESKAPAFWWLINNGYTNQQFQEEKNQGDVPDDVDIDTELVWNNNLQSALERGTVCKGTFKPESNGEVYIEYYKNGEVKIQAYNDEPDYQERHSNNIVPDPVTIKADDIKVRKHAVYCQFSFTELMNKGFEYGGKFVSKSGDMSLGGNDGDDGSAKFNVEWNLDSDGDGILDNNDQCPNTGNQGFGLKNNGCPIKDSDSDGVGNNVDICSQTPQEASVDSKGCALDGDSDGVPDYQDQCPQSVGKPQFNGCPDSDGDGVPDRKDSCPRTGSQGLGVKENGCPVQDDDDDGVVNSQDQAPNTYGSKTNGKPTLLDKIINILGLRGFFK